MVTPFMHLRPIGKRAAKSVGHASAVSHVPSIFTVYQSGKAYKEQSDYKTAIGALNKIVFQGRPSHGLSHSEVVVVDGSIQVQLLSSDISIPKPQNNAAYNGVYMVKSGNNPPCWIISGQGATEHPDGKPITLNDDLGKAIITIYTELPVNAGPCATP